MTLRKAYFLNLDNPRLRNRRIEVQFNPTELAFSKGVQYADIAIPGLDAPAMQFVRGNTETLTVELFFDGTDEAEGPRPRSVSERVEEFYALVKQDPDTHAPPRCLFGWGASPAEAEEGRTAGEVSRAPSWFTCVVEGVDRRFLLFTPDGVPIRARVTVRLKEYKTIEQMVKGLHSADHTKAHPLKRRERLDQVAAREYEAAAEWRRIAEENEIDDPLRVGPGTLLKLPPVRVEAATREP
jgi:hypothetical protein